MKKIIFFIFFAFSTSAFADNQINWTGFYGSAMIGYTSGDVGDDNGTFQYIPSGTYDFWGTGSSFNGLSGNLKLGFNKQIDENLIGVEIGGTLQDAKSNGTAITSYDDGTGRIPDSTPFSVLSKTRVQTYESLSVRLGHIFNEKTLLYVYGGGALGQIKSTLNAPNDATDNWLADRGVSASVSDKKNEFGYAVGLGVEHKFNDKWALRANYEYVDFGKVNFNYQHRSVPGYEADINLSNSIRFSNISAGVSYAF